MDPKKRLKPWLISAWCAWCLTLAMDFFTKLISEPGKWYSDSLPLRRQTDAFLNGHISLDAIPISLTWDEVWDHGVQQVWGLGVPAFRLIFELLAKAFGHACFPDRITFLIACFACFTFLFNTFAFTPHSESGWKRFGKHCFLALTLLAPPFITLIRTRFQVYEEVAAYGYLYTLVLFAALLRACQNPTNTKMIAFAAWAGIGVFIRPTLLFYGAASLAFALLFAWRAHKSRWLISSMALLFLTCFASLALLNWSRFGAFGEFGHTLNLTDLNHNTFSLKFDYPFHHEPVLSAVKDQLGCMFLTQELNGHDYYEQDFFLGQSTTYRWHEMYFTTFNISYLSLFTAGCLTWLLNIRQLRKPWNNFNTDATAGDNAGTQRFDSAFTLIATPWALATFSCMFLFYLWSPSLASRYNIDFLPAMMVAISGLAWNLFEFNLVSKTKTAILTGYAATVLWLGIAIAISKVSPGHSPQVPYDFNLVQWMAHPPDYTAALPTMTSYTLGITKFDDTPYNCDGWDRRTGEIKPVVTVYATDPKKIMLDLFTPQGTIKETDLDPIKIKVGLEYLLRESTEIHSNRACVIFQGPKKNRYQTGLQICFLGFIRPDDLGRKEPELRLAGVSFSSTVLTNSTLPPLPQANQGTTNRTTHCPTPLLQ